MPRASGQKEYISLAGGLITETSDLSFPEGYTSAELNFVLDRDGMIRRRRQGFNPVSSVFDITDATAVIDNVFYWRNPSLVCVIYTDSTPSTKLRFHSVNDNFTFVQEVTISNLAAETQVSQTTNFLTITFDTDERPILCEYDEITDEINVSTVSIHIRDFELVDDTFTVAERPVALNDNHRYNLYNAGWYLDRRDQSTASQPFDDPVDVFFNDTEGSPTGVYPSNADIVSVGLSINENGVTTFRPDEVKNNNVGNTEAPRGHYVFDINDFNRTTRTGAVGKLNDGLPNTTLTALTSVDVSLIDTYDPEEPPSDTNPTGGDIDPIDPPYYDPDEEITPDIQPPSGLETP